MSEWDLLLLEVSPTLYLFRRGSNDTGTDKHFDKKDFIDTLTSWQFWYFSIQYFFLTVSQIKWISDMNWL
jgi:hypothetical protein